MNKERAYLRSNQVANGLLRRSNSLVVAACAAVGVVAGGTRRGDGGTGQLDGGLGGVVLGRGLVLLRVTLGLVGSTARHGAYHGLDGAGDAVDGSLEGGGLVLVL